MRIDLIIQKGESGKKLNNQEKKELMLHALDLLKFIETETLLSIERAHSILELKYKTAA